MSDLNAQQTASLLKGDQVAVLHDVADVPWPRVVVYQIVEAAPEEVAAVFFDYKNAHTFVPNLLKSEISVRRSACDQEVDYIVDVPLLADEAYTARNRLVAAKDGIYLFEWNLVRATSTKASLGNLRIEPKGEGTLIRYTNLVTPNSSVASLLRGVAVDQMKRTVAAIVRQVEEQKSKKPQDLALQVSTLRAALAEL